MLASMASPPQSVPLREHSHLNIQDSTRDLSDSLNLEDRLCPGCKRSAVSEQGGLVVAFGQSFFHVDCFKCAKCGNQVTADTNLLLLSDGSPICADCSYNCNVCHLPILDEAIMTGDDSYHAHCFKCKVCKDRIDELVFAKTSQGIYCMNCHNKRMIKIRSYNQKKTERERANGGTGSSRSRDREARGHHDTSLFTTGNDSFSRPSSSRSNGNASGFVQREISSSGVARNTESLSYTRPTVKPKGPPQFHDGQEPRALPQTPPAGIPTAMHNQSPSLSPSFPSHPAVTVAPPSEVDYSDPLKSSPLPLQPSANGDAEPNGMRRSYDDGVRPLSVLLGQISTPANSALRPGSDPSQSDSLNVTPKQEKRRSINPGLVLPNFSDALPSGAVKSTLSPQSAGFSNHRSARSPTPPSSHGGRESPHYALQSRESGQRGQASRPTSQTSSVHSYHTFATAIDREMARSRSSSISTMDDEDSTVILESSRHRSAGSASRSQIPGTQAGSNDNGSHDQPNGNRQSTVSSLKADEERESAVSSRSTSPYHQADVPRGIEDALDSDTAAEGTSPAHDQLPPPPPPKNGDEPPEAQSPIPVDDPEVSKSSPLDTSDDMSESSPVEHTSHATFIAPALPPIRFSLNDGDFSELLSSVQGNQALKSIATLLQEPEDSPSSIPKTSSEATLTTTPPTPATTEEHTHQDPQRAMSLPMLDVRTDKPINKFSRTSSIDDKPLPAVDPTSSPLDSTSLTGPLNTLITLTDSISGQTATLKPDASNMVTLRLREALKASQEHGAQQVLLDGDLVAAVLETLDSRKAAYNELKEKLDGMKRTSKHFIDGLTVAQAEYDKELKARREAEAEVTRLRVLLSGQAAKLTALSGDDRRHEVRQQLSKELNDSLSGLEHHLSQLKLERDMTLAEMEELSSSKGVTSPDNKPAGNLGRSLTKRLDNLKVQYQRDLIPLTEQREILGREIAELKAIRDMFLEETTALNARNEELAQLSHIYSRRLESIPETPLKQNQATSSLHGSRGSIEKIRNGAQTPSIAPSLSASTSGSSTIYEEPDRYMKPPKSDSESHTPRKFKWMGSNKPKDMASPASFHLPDHVKGKGHLEHNFQQLSILRFTRCDHCGDKMWGSQLRCTVCNVSIHVRCVAVVHVPCAQLHADESRGALLPSLFGRDLAEQVRADSQGDDRQVPIIVEKCIAAVEATALEYEGIYRKTGGSSQSKTITQLFERGDYNAFDLLDTDRFNDICSVTSVLKTYLRSMPNPLLTFELYSQFVQGVATKDPIIKNRTLSDLVKQLPTEHYYTLRMLMLHLNRIHQLSKKNLMTARNLGVVFGPTLIRSHEPSAEFSDMAQRALLVEWLIESATQLFNGTA